MATNFKLASNLASSYFPFLFPFKQWLQFPLIQGERAGDFNFFLLKEGDCLRREQMASLDFSFGHIVFYPPRWPSPSWRERESRDYRTHIIPMHQVLAGTVRRKHPVRPWFCFFLEDYDVYDLGSVYGIILECPANNTLAHQQTNCQIKEIFSLTSHV